MREVVPAPSGETRQSQAMSRRPSTSRKKSAMSSIAASKSADEVLETAFDRTAAAAAPCSAARRASPSQELGSRSRPRR